MSRVRARAILRSAAGLALSGLFLWLVFRTVNPATILPKLRDLPLPAILLCTTTQIICQVIRVSRWGLMMRRLGEITWRQVIAIGSIGIAAVSLLPARLGELARPTLASEETPVGFMATASTVFAERLIDGWIVSLAFLGTLLSLSVRAASRNLASSAYAFVVACAVAGLATWLLVRHGPAVPEPLRRIMARLSPSGADRVGRLYAAFVEGLIRLANQRILMPYLGLSLLLWTIEALSIWLLFPVLGTQLTALAALTVLCALVLGVAVPAGPAHLGLFEYAAVVALELFAVQPDAAAMYGALLHAIQLVVLAAFGIAGSLLAGISLRRIAGISRRDDDTASPQAG